MDYKKDFDGWNIKKQKINRRLEQPFFKEREIWWCSLGCNIGSEEDGKNTEFERPVIIFRIFSTDLVWVIPLTTRIGKLGSRFTYSFICKDLQQTADISQLRPVSSKRFLRYAVTISFHDFQMIRKYFSDLS